MTRATWLLAAFCGLATASAAAAAEPARYSVTLHDEPGYRGRSVVVYGDRADLGVFAGRARSAQVRGTWRLCQGAGFSSRCEVMAADVPDLTEYNLSGRVGSAQLLSGAAARARRPAAAPRLAAPPARYAQAAPERPRPAVRETPQYAAAYEREPEREPEPARSAPPAPSSPPVRARVQTVVDAPPAPDPRGVYAGRDPSGRPLYFQSQPAQAYAAPQTYPAPSYSVPTYSAPAYPTATYAGPAYTSAPVYSPREDSSRDYASPRPAYAPRREAAQTYSSPRTYSSPQAYADPLRYPAPVDAPVVRSYQPRPAPAQPPPPSEPAYAPEPVYSAPAYPEPEPAEPADARDAGGGAFGRRSVFFARPSLHGQDVAASPRGADEFCRAQGLGVAVYYDQVERAPRAVDVTGRVVGEGFILRDVVCRR